jgi:hypothetical protein
VGLQKARAVGARGHGGAEKSMKIIQIILICAGIAIAFYAVLSVLYVVVVELLSGKGKPHD